jgi:hypothetical protein
MNYTEAEVKEILEQLGSRTHTFTQLLEMSAYRLSRTNAVDRDTGEKLLLEAAAEAETIHLVLRTLIEERARNGPVTGMGSSS